MKKRHIGEFAKTGFANSGRAAGMGILADNYDDESGGEGKIRCGAPVGIKEREDRAKKENNEAPVSTYYLTKEELEELDGK